MNENEIQLFANDEFGQVRVIEKNGEMWFVAADVCKALGIVNPTVAVSKLEENERAKLSIGRQGETNVVNEPGLYLLVLKSRKSSAVKFQRWIAHEVIPFIRKHGAYMTDNALERALSDPREMAKILNALADERDRNKALTEDNERLNIENQALYMGNSTWEARTIINALVPKIAYKCRFSIPYTWTELYKEAKRKYHFDLYKRYQNHCNQGGNPNRPVIDFANDDELRKLAIIASTVAYRWNVDFVATLNPVNAEQAQNLIDMELLKDYQPVPATEMKSEKKEKVRSASEQRPERLQWSW